ncbi:hypothetical protein E3J61_00265 [Candidatus Dependentiae bacterium]|nr:MAG: hypothetical protein E3J61_00265 [Candidatus Dependentiae bacterium]
MKKSILFSLLILSLNGLYAMEMELSEGVEKAGNSEFSSLKPIHIKLQDAVQHIPQYKHDHLVESLCWSPNGRYIASAGFLDNVKIFDVTTGKVETEYKGGLGLGFYLCWLSGRYEVSDESDDQSVDPEHNGWLKVGRWSDQHYYEIKTLTNTNANRKAVIDCRSFNVLSLSPDGRYIATCRGGRTVCIASLIPFLLSTHQLQEDTTPFQRRLLERLQKKLLNEKNSLIIDRSERDTLKEMSDVKEMLTLEPKSKGKNPTWKAQLKGVAKK